MTREQLKKTVNFQSQLLQFALGIEDEMKDSPEWVTLSKELLSISVQMMRLNDQAASGL